MHVINYAEKKLFPKFELFGKLNAPSPPENLEELLPKKSDQVINTEESIEDFLNGLMDVFPPYVSTNARPDEAYVYKNKKDSNIFIRMQNLPIVLVFDVDDLKYIPFEELEKTSERLEQFYNDIKDKVFGAYGFDCLPEWVSTEKDYENFDLIFWIEDDDGDFYYLFTTDFEEDEDDGQ